MKGELTHHQTLKDRYGNLSVQCVQCEGFYPGITLRQLIYNLFQCDCLTPDV